MDPSLARALASEPKHGLGFSQMKDGTHRQALVIYDREGKELLRVTYDDAASALLKAFAPQRPE